MEAGTLVRNSRIAAGLTQTELARRAGTTQAAVARLEGGRLSPKVSTLQKLLAAAGCRLELGASPAASSIDETLIARQLKLTPAERLKAFEATYQDVQRLAGSARRARGRVD